MKNDTRCWRQVSLADIWYKSTAFRCPYFVIILQFRFALTSICTAANWSIDNVSLLLRTWFWSSRRERSNVDIFFIFNRRFSCDASEEGNRTKRRWKMRHAVSTIIWIKIKINYKENSFYTIVESRCKIVRLIFTLQPCERRGRTTIGWVHWKFVANKSSTGLEN